MWLYWMWTLIHSGILLLWSICISILYEPYIGNYIYLKHMHIYIIWTIGYNIIWSIHYMMHGLYFNYLLWVAWFVFKAYIIWSICIYIYCFIIIIHFYGRVDTTKNHFTFTSLVLKIVWRGNFCQKYLVVQWCHKIDVFMLFFSYAFSKTMYSLRGTRK
jgi:hypothetical protein